MLYINFGISISPPQSSVAILKVNDINLNLRGAITKWQASPDRMRLSLALEESDRLLELLKEILLYLKLFWFTTNANGFRKRYSIDSSAREGEN